METKTWNAPGKGVEFNEQLNKSHKQCSNWLSEIELWHIEIHFFIKLLTDEDNNQKSIEHSNLLPKLLDEASHYHDSSIAKLKKEVENHELFLREMLQHLPDRSAYKYWSQYNNIHDRIESFKLALGMFKKKVIHYLQSR